MIILTTNKLIDENHFSYIYIVKYPSMMAGLIDIFKHILGGSYSGGLVFRGRIILGGHFVLVSAYLRL